MKKEDLLFRLETFKGQLENFETSLRRSLRAETVDKRTMEKEISRLKRTYEPLREYLSHFVDGQYLTSGLRADGISESTLNRIASCMREVSITSTQIARMSEKQFAGFIKGIEYSMSRKQEDGERAALDEPDGVRLSQFQPQSQTTRPVGEGVNKDKRFGVYATFVAVGLGLFAIIFSVYLFRLHVDSLNSIQGDIAETKRQNRRMISDITASFEDQTRLIESVRKDVEQSGKWNRERIGDMGLSLTNLRENLRGIGGPDLEGNIYLPLKSGSVSVALEIDPFSKKGFIRGWDHRTGKKVFKRLDPATTNLIIWELNELGYWAD